MGVKQVCTVCVCAIVSIPSKEFIPLVSREQQHTRRDTLLPHQRISGTLLVVLLLTRVLDDFQGRLNYFLFFVTFQCSESAEKLENGE